MNVSAEENVREGNENKIPKDFFNTLLHLTKKQKGVKLFWSGIGNYSVSEMDICSFAVDIKHSVYD